MTARWRYAAFGVALGAVWLVLLLWAADIDPREPFVPARTHSLPGSRYHAVFGKATPDGQRLRVSSAAEDYSALQATALPDLAAADFPILRYSFDGFPHTLELSLVFRTSDAPDDVQSISLPAPTNGSAAIDLSHMPSWSGTIVEIGFSQFPVAQLVPPDEGFRPFVLSHARLESDSWRGRLAATWSSWFERSPWQLISVSAIGPGETGDITPHAPRLPLVLALALAGFALVARIVLRWRGSRLALALSTVTALAWLGLDVAWLRDVSYRRDVDREIWGAIPFAQRQDYVADERTFAAAMRLKDLLEREPPSTRILVNAETPHEVLRLIYLLAPLNASGVGGLANVAPTAVPVGTILVNYNVNRPRPLNDQMRIGRTRTRVKVIDRNQDLVVYRVEATIP